MALSIYTDSRLFNTKPLMVLIALNAAIAAAVLFAWTVISVLVAEPISWATWAPISEGSQPDLFDYPFVLLWALPVSGMVFAWVAKNLYHKKLAYLAAMAPLAIMVMVFAYFHFVPEQFH